VCSRREKPSTPSLFSARSGPGTEEDGRDVHRSREWAAFDELGFRVEATLGEWVVEGKSRDLVVVALECAR
jgi:hypothetical protein